MRDERGPPGTWPRPSAAAAAAPAARWHLRPSASRRRSPPLASFAGVFRVGPVSSRATQPAALLLLLLFCRVDIVRTRCKLLLSIRTRDPNVSESRRDRRVQQVDG